MYQPGVVGASSRNSFEAKLSTESHFFFFFCGGNTHAKGPAPVFFFLFLRVAGLPCATWIVFVGYLNGR